MKVITILVPVEGVTVHLRAVASTTNPEAVIVVPDGVEASPASKAVTSRSPSQPFPTEVHDASYVIKRLRKLRVKSEAAAINSIKAMFQFNTPVSDTEAKKRLEEARRKGLLKIDGAGKITFKDA
jgi:hypothetical protein